MKGREENKKKQHCTQIPSRGTGFTAPEKTKLIIKRSKLNSRSILWHKHGKFNANDEYFWSSSHNTEVTFQLLETIRMEMMADVTSQGIPHRDYES